MRSAYRRLIVEGVKRQGFLLLILMLFTGVLIAQKQFPPINGVTLDDKKIRIPHSNGKFSVVAIAFDRSAEDALKKWLQPLYDSFIKKESGDPFDLSEFYDVNFVFIPLIQGFKRVAEDFKKNTDSQFWPYVLDIEKTDVKDIQRKLGVTDTDKPYFYILDQEGKIVKAVNGPYNDNKLAALEEAIE